MFDFFGGSQEALHPQFVEAFKDNKYRGFDLSWLEMEILQYAIDESPISDIYEKMIKEYGKENVGHRSNFYRKVDSLVSKEYLQDTSRDNDDIVTRTIVTVDKGYLELGRHSRYFIERQIKDIFPHIWLDIFDKTKDIVENILEQKVCVVTADFNNLSSFDQFTKQIFRNHLQIEEMENLSGSYYYINFDDTNVPDPEHGVTILPSKVDDWPLRSNYIDVCLMFNPLSTFGNNSILAEPIRVLKQGGYLIIAEIAELESKLATTIFKSFTELVNLMMKSEVWTLPTELLTVEQITEQINEFNDSLSWVRDPIPDIINTVFILQKK